MTAKKKKGEKSTLTGGLDVVGFDAKGKDHFQACALSYFWIFLLPVAVVEVTVDLIKVPNNFHLVV